MTTKTIITCDCCGRELQKGLFAVMQIPRANLAERRAPVSPENANQGLAASVARHQQDIVHGGVVVRPHDMCEACAAAYRALIERFFSLGGKNTKAENYCGGRVSPYPTPKK